MQIRKSDIRIIDTKKYGTIRSVPTPNCYTFRPLDSLFGHMTGCIED